MRLPESQQRMVGEAGYAGVFLGSALSYLLFKRQLLSSLASTTNISSIDLSGIMIFVLLPIAIGIFNALAARYVLAKFSSDRPVSFSGVAELIKSLIVIGITYLALIQPTLSGNALHIKAAAVAIGALLEITIAIKLIILARQSMRVEQE